MEKAGSPVCRYVDYKWLDSKSERNPLILKSYLWH